MRRTLAEAQKALKGLVVMSPELEALTSAVFDNRVPAAWAAKAYPSLKPLSSWTVDLLDRVSFVRGWVESGPPAVFWISGFFFPQAFLTGTLQNYARKARVPIDSVAFTYHVRDDVSAPSKETQPPEDGCYISGLFLEGARWSAEDGALAESRPKELFTQFPVVWLKPEQRRDKPAAPVHASTGAESAEVSTGGGASTHVYECPVYKTLARAGTLSTTGHSTNFVMDLELPSRQPSAHWVGRSTALFCALAF